MKKRNVIAICLLAGMFSACSEQLDVPVGGDIVLKASVDNLEVATRTAVKASPYEGIYPTVETPLEAAVWFSTTPDVYANTPESDTETHLPIRTTAKFESDGWTYPEKYNNDNLKYPINNNPVYCVGLYPQTGWSIDAEATRSVSYDIDGTTDLMFASQISGTWNTPFSAPLNFGHLQTWIKVCICATSEEAPDAWGKVTDIKILTDDKVTVRLADGTKTYSTTKKELDLIDTHIPLEITTTQISEEGVFCAPATSYTLMVTTEKQDPKEITITDLYNLSNTKITNKNDLIGKLCVLTLYFNEFATINGVCTLEAWSNEDENLYPDSN